MRRRYGHMSLKMDNVIMSEGSSSWRIFILATQVLKRIRAPITFKSYFQ